MMKRLFILFLVILTQSTYGASDLPVYKIKLPEGFHIEVFTDRVESAREMAFSPSGNLFVGSMNGNVYAVLTDWNTKRVTNVVTIAKGLKQPVGVAYHNQSLYISAVSRILKLDNIEKNLNGTVKPVIVSSAYPADTWHGWKFIKFGPDGMLYVPVGSPCNICIQKNLIYGSITRIRPEGGPIEIIENGIRNTVGFDWSPVTGELWFTDNGRDYLGDNLPPDELNRAPVKGMNFGFPFMHGKSIVDPDFKFEMPADFKFTPPEMELGPHVASLGMRFYTGSMFPAEYKNQIFIAEHGSWNRSTPIGYRVTLVRLDPPGRHAEVYETFAEGWLAGDSAWGRPADVEVGPDGALYISDDQAGAVYRVWYQK